MLRRAQPGPWDERSAAQGVAERDPETGTGIGYLPYSAEDPRETWLPNGSGILLARAVSSQACGHRAYLPRRLTVAEGSEVDR